MDKIKSVLPGFGFMIKVVIVVIVFNAVKELAAMFGGGKAVAIAERPVAGVRGLFGMA